MADMFFFLQGSKLDKRRGLTNGGFTSNLNGL